MNLLSRIGNAVQSVLNKDWTRAEIIWLSTAMVMYTALLAVIIVTQTNSSIIK